MHILYLYIYTYTRTHTLPYIYICAYTHSCACVYHLPSIDGRWDDKGIQDLKGYATACPKHSQDLFCY